METIWKQYGIHPKKWNSIFHRVRVDGLGLDVAPLKEAELRPSDMTE